MAIKDGLLLCLYCGNTMKSLTKQQIEVFGKPMCCDYFMLEMDMAKLHTVVKFIDKLKHNLEQHILEGMI